ncbi:unnamed protein product, partial [Ixodes pacificus]
MGINALPDDEINNGADKEAGNEAGNEENEAVHGTDKGPKRNPDNRADDEADNKEDRGPKSPGCEAYDCMGKRKQTTEQMMKNRLSVSIVKRGNEKENEVNYEADKGLKRNPDSRACDEVDNEEEKGPKS